MNIIQDLFGKSPFGPLVEHTKKVHECVEMLKPLMEALVNEDYKEIRRIRFPGWNMRRIQSNMMCGSIFPGATLCLLSGWSLKGSSAARIK
jgi:hypothetical protein